MMRFMRTIVRIAPSPALARFVRAFTVIETTEETNCLLLPDGTIELGFRYAGHATHLDGESASRLPGLSLTGMRDTARRVRTSSGGGVVLATFREGGLARFFREPLHEVFGATIGLGQLAGRDEVDALQSQIAGAADAPARVAIVEQFLLARRAHGSPDPLVDAAVRVIRATGGSIRIGALAPRLGISRDRLEKRFRRAVGTSPKQLASIVRLQRAVELHRPGVSLADLAADAGYSDQSHFTREFRAATGEPPHQFFIGRGRWSTDAHGWQPLDLRTEHACRTLQALPASAVA